MWGGDLNKKAQLIGVLAFVVILIGVIILAPIVLKIWNAILGGVSNSITPQDAVAGATIDYGQNKLNQFWDTIVLSFLLVNIVLLLISSYYVDVSPFWVILYVVGLATLFLIFPALVQTTEPLYNQTGVFANETANLPKTSYIYDNAGVVLLGVVFISGIIMFGKIYFGGKQ